MINLPSKLFTVIWKEYRLDLNRWESKISVSGFIIYRYQCFGKKDFYRPLWRFPNPKYLNIKANVEALRLQELPECFKSMMSSNEINRWNKVNL